MACETDRAAKVTQGDGPNWILKLIPCLTNAPPKYVAHITILHVTSLTNDSGL